MTLLLSKQILFIVAAAGGTGHLAVSNISLNVGPVYMILFSLHTGLELCLYGHASLYATVCSPLFYTCAMGPTNGSDNALVLDYLYTVFI